MQIDSGQDTPRPEQQQGLATESERAGRKPVEVFYEVQKAIDAANIDGAISVWRDRGVKDPTNNFYDGSQPAFITFFNPDEASSFARKLDELKEAKDASEVERIENELRWKGDDAVYSEGVPEAIYQDGKWLVDPDKLLSEEQERKIQIVTEGDPHVPARLLRMGKSGLLSDEDAGNLAAHMTGCTYCSERLRLLHFEDPDVLTAELRREVDDIAGQVEQTLILDGKKLSSRKPLMFKSPPKGLGSGGLK